MDTSVRLVVVAGVRDAIIRSHVTAVVVAEVSVVPKNMQS